MPLSDFSRAWVCVPSSPGWCAARESITEPGVPRGKGKAKTRHEEEAEEDDASEEEEREAGRARASPQRVTPREPRCNCGCEEACSARDSLRAPPVGDPGNRRIR